MKRDSTAATIAMLTICVFSWGSVFPTAKLVLDHISSPSLVLWRFVIAIASLALYLGLRRQSWPALSTAQYLVLAVIGALGIGGFNLALFAGLRETTATNGALIMALSPLVTSLLAALLARRWPDRTQCFSLAVALCGVVLVITNGELQRLLQLDFNRGDLLIICGMLAWSVYTIASQRVGHWLPTVSFTLVTMIAGGLTLLLYSLARPDVHPWAELRGLAPWDLGVVVYIGLFATVIGYLFWINGVRRLGPAKASLFFNLVPVFAALTALALGQPLTAIQCIGTAIVLFGLTTPMLLRLRMTGNAATQAG
ncbi:DMT family transporter [Microbulbifer sp. SAOS-129_SWC]|uniref:DMT family transporter n=1 Tax=Microbulbifer sp. SAOS-129_SWC TaxID=3145235 RepID=UPI003216A4B1